MNYACTTQVPNALFDQWMKNLSLAELKVLLLVIRQTWGWVADKSGRRKDRDWLSCSRIEERTGLSKRSISMATKALVQRGLLAVSNRHGEPLSDATMRRGRMRLYYALAYPHVSHSLCATSAKSAVVDQQNLLITKPTPTKPTLSTTGKAWGIRRRPIAPREHPPFGGFMSELLPAALAPGLMERLYAPAHDGS